MTDETKQQAGPDDSRPGAVDHLRTIVGHHAWASLALIDRCLTLSPAQLDLSAPGTFGSIHATLDHLVRADRRYMRGITGDPPGPAAVALPLLLDLRAEMERQERKWHDVVDHIDDLDATMPPIHGEYPEITHAVGLFIAQAVWHGQEHRAHVCTILGAHGLEVPDLSGWTYILVERERAAEAPESR